MRKYVLIMACVAFGPCFAQNEMIDSLSAVYEQSLEQLSQSRQEVVDNLSTQAEAVTLNPYYFRLLVPGTYYENSMRQVLGLDWSPASVAGSLSLSGNNSSTGDGSLDAHAASNQALAQLYVMQPGLVLRTEAALKETPALRKETTQPVDAIIVSKLSEKAVAADIDADMLDTVALVVKKPNFWKFSGSSSLQFTQSYFSENWYQGGENNYAGIGMLTLDANFDNKQKVQWDNRLEAQIGFQTTNTDDYHKFRVTSNLLRLTSKLGYKAIKNWYYTAQLTTNTQLAPYYEKNRQTWKARFGTPWYLTLSVGMDYKYKSKNGKFDLSVYLSPLAYYMTYVERLGAIVEGKDYRERYYGDMYGITKANKGIYCSHSFHKFGPNFTVNSKITVMKNVYWTSRLYFFSNFHSTLVEWENKLDFTINKYLTANFYAYPRFDDSSQRYKNDKKHGGNYLMFKEWLSLGLSYRF